MKSRTAAVLTLSVVIGMHSGGIRACDGDNYWSEPAQVKTWYSRQLVSFPAPDEKVTDDILKEALSTAGLSPCPMGQRDLIGQDVKVIRACRSNVRIQGISVGWDNYNDCTQVMVRLLERSGPLGTLEVLTRTKWGKGGAALTQADEQSKRAVTLAQLVASKLQEKLALLR